MIRKATQQDTGAVLGLLSQVLEVHAAIRPDIFIPGTTKYTSDELMKIFADENTPVFVWEDERNKVCGYAFCVIKQPPFSNTMKPCKTLFIDDLCVDENCRGKGIGEQIFTYVKQKAKQLGCNSVTLNVWEGNTAAQRFYEKMGMKIKETQMEITV